MGNQVSRIRARTRKHCTLEKVKSCTCCVGCCDDTVEMPVTSRTTENLMNNFETISLPYIDDVDSISSEVLTIRSVDLCIEQNGSAHHTDRFEMMKRRVMPKLIVRRGQPFRLRLLCNRAYDPSRDAITLILTVADVKQPNLGHGTLIGLLLSNNVNDKGQPDEWAAVLKSTSGDKLEILIKPAANALVTQWKVDIDTKLLNEKVSKSFSLPQAIYVLFNPWCPQDQVFIEDEAARKEYVLTDTTLMWRGSYNRLRPSPWKLGQFERDVLDSALYIISYVGKISPSVRRDPVRIARALSAAVNSPDDDGVLLGNWSNDFSGGTAPTKWGGSTEILQKFYKTKKPVKFAQCWVFAGTLTAIARCVGIPSRIVTNYSSAHDTQASLTVDYFVDDDGKIMEEMNSDSIWNYHVWNEVWMTRPDLNHNSHKTYDGWQAIDATPQETSDGLYRCGPASVVAVKKGEIMKPYDNSFLYASVNADKVYWRYKGPANPLKLMKKDELGIGHFISTKAIGRWERQDITKSYKYEEKSKDERETMLKALKQTNSAFSRYYLNEEFNEVQFDFEVKDDIKIGEPFSVVLEITNKSSEKKHVVNGTLFVESVLYTGKQRESVKFRKFTETIEPQTAIKVKLDVGFEEYFKKLLDQSAFNIACMANVEDTDYEYFAQDDFRVRKPDIKFSFNGTPVMNTAIEVFVKLENPLPIPLKKGIFQIEGAGLEHPVILKVADTPVAGIAEARFVYKPPYVTSKAVLEAKFSSKELDDVDGFKVFEIKPAEEDILMPDRSHNEVIRRTDVIH